MNYILLLFSFLFSTLSFCIPPKTNLNDPIHVMSIATGKYHTCEVHMNGDLYCYGRNNSKQLGLGDDADEFYSTPQKVEFFSKQGIKIAQVKAGGEHTCVLTQNTFELYCFGGNQLGQLGIGKIPNKSTFGIPQKVDFKNKIEILEVGSAHTCFVDEYFDLYCFGSNYNGQLGIDTEFGDVYYPRLIAFFYNKNLKIAQLTAAGSGTCAVTQKKFHLYCFGNNEARQFGMGEKLNYMFMSTPHLVHFFNQEKFNFDEKRFVNYTDYKEKQNPLRKGKFHALSFSEDHMCVVMNKTYELYCSGWRDTSKLGVGELKNYETHLYFPMRVDYFYQRNIKIDQVFTGLYHTCVSAFNTQGLFCFGNVNSGALGLEDIFISRFPVQIPDVKVMKLASSGNSTHTCFIDLTNLSKCFGDNTYGQLGLGTSVIGNYGDERGELISKLPNIFYPSQQTSFETESE